MPQRSLFLLWLLLTLVMAPHSRAAETQFFPATLGKGALLIFVRPEGADGKPSGRDPDDRCENVYVWSGDDAGPPQRVLRCDVPLPTFLHRVTQSVVLVRFGDRLQLFDLKLGTMEQLWKGDEQTDLLRVDGNAIFFLRHTIPNGMIGYRLKSAPNGNTVLGEWHRPRDKLCVIVLGGESKEFVTPLIEEVLKQDAKGLWLVTAETQPRLLHVSLTGEITDKLPWHTDWAACEAKIAFSPNERYLGLSILRTDQDFHRTRDLVVMSRDRGEMQHVVRDIDCHLPPISSSTPSLRLDWLDDHMLKIGTMFFKDDKILDVETLKLSSAAEPPPKLREETDERKVVGKFETTHGKVWFGKDAKLAATVLDEEGRWSSACLEFSPEQDWAALSSPDLNGVLVLDGTQKKRRKLIEGWCYDLRWLGASDAVPTAKPKQ